MIKKQIVILETFDPFNVDGEAPEALRRIADMVEEGYVEGYQPRWYIESVGNDESVKD